MVEKLSILVVDDEIINLQNISHYLTRQGYSVQIADSGYAAMELIDTHHFDLVITDLKMEGVDGNQVMDYTKQKLPNTEVIIMTGYATVNSAVEAMAQGAYYYVPKPIKLQNLKTLVEKALEKHVMQREISELKQQILSKKGRNTIRGPQSKDRQIKR